MTAQDMGDVAAKLRQWDAPGHIADAVRDACRTTLGKVVSFDESSTIANAIFAKIVALLDTLEPKSGERGTQEQIYAAARVISEDGWSKDWPDAVRLAAKISECFVLPEPKSDSRPVDEAEKQARELLAATINRKVFPGKAEHLLAGGDDLLFDAGDALSAIVAALTQPASDAGEMREALRLREALTPYGETKAAYIGEFSWTDWLEDEHGISQGHERRVPWTTIKEIMAAIRNRAGVEKLDEADCLAALSHSNHRGEDA